MHSPDVANLQTILINLGFLVPGNSTGYYGPLTTAAVQKFKATHNIVSSGTPSSTGYGSVGPLTRTALNALGSTSTSTSTSTSSTSPTTNQSIIDSLKQEIAQLVALVTDLTAKSPGCFIAYPPHHHKRQYYHLQQYQPPQSQSSQPDLLQGSSGSEVTLLQKFFASHSYLSADNVTGFYGPLTQSAVESFQSSYNLAAPGTPATEYGTVGPNT